VHTHIPLISLRHNLRVLNQKVAMAVNMRWGSGVVRRKIPTDG